MKQIQIKDPIYRLCLQVIFDEKDFEKMSWVDVSWYKWTHVMINNNWRYANLIYIRDRKDIWCIWHELLHFVVKNLNIKWIEINSENDEAAAYLFEYYMNEIIKWLNKRLNDCSFLTSKYVSKKV